MVCKGCGMYIKPVVDKQQEILRCPECGHEEHVRILPLFIVTGASGTGKTAVVPELRRLLPDWDVFETDSIHGIDWQQVKANWLRIAFSLAQSNRPVILCGTILPEQIDQCDHQHYFSTIYYLNLHCNDATRAARLRSRPAWRGCDESFIENMQHFAAWLLENANTAFDPPMPTVDTTNAPPLHIANLIKEWALSHWENETKLKVES